MLQKMRDQTQSAAFKVLVGIIVFVLAIFGFGTFNLFSGGDPAVASVNGDDITQAMLVNAAERERRRIAAQLGGDFDPNLIDPVRLQSAVLEQLIGRALLTQAADDLGVGVSRAQVDAAVVRNPSFQVDGAFSQDAYVAAVRSLGYTPQAFLDEMKVMLSLEQLREGIVSTSFLTQTELREQSRLLNQRRDLAYLSFTPDAFADQVEVTDDEVALRYEENQLDYMTEENLDIAYVALSWEDLLDDPSISVSEDDIVSAYEADRALAPASEERRSSHILLQVNDERSEEAAQNEMAELRARIEAGESFADLATQYSEDPGSAPTGGDLGYAGRGIFDPGFEASLFELQPGEISQPVRSSFGYHLIRLEDVRQTEYPTFEAEREQIEQRLKKAAAETLFVDRVRELDNLAFENPNGLEAIADQLGLEVQTVNAVTRTEGQGIFANAALRDAAFSDEVLESGFNSPAVEFGLASAAVLRVLQRHEPEPIPLAQVADKIRAEIVTERASALAADAQTSAMARLAAGESVAEVAESYGLQWQKFELVRRTDPQVPGEVLQAAFSLTRPADGGKTVGETPLAAGGQAVITVTRVEDGDFAALSEVEIGGVREFLAQRTERTDFEGFYQTVEEEASIERPE